MSHHHHPHLDLDVQLASAVEVENGVEGTRMAVEEISEEMLKKYLRKITEKYLRKMYKRYICFFVACIACLALMML